MVEELALGGGVGGPAPAGGPELDLRRSLFARIATERAKGARARAIGERLLEHIRDEVVIENAAVTNAHGLSIYIPHFNDYATSYGEPGWSRDGGWDEFLKWVTSAWP